MYQAQFIQMWKTLYDMCTGSPDEQQLYHSISTVATLLLQIGEVGKQYKSRPTSADPSPGKPVISSPSQNTTGNDNKTTTAIDDDVEILSAKLDGAKLDAQSTSASIVEYDDSVTTAQLLDRGAKGDSSSRTAVQGQAHTTCLTPVHNDPLSDCLHDISNKQDSDSESEDIIRQLEEAHKTDISATGKSHEGVDDNSAVDVRLRRTSLLETPSKAARESKPDPDWSVNFEQFLASMLTEPHLVAIFEKDTNIITAVEAFRQRRLKPSDDDLFGVSKSTPPGKKS